MDILEGISDNTLYNSLGRERKALVVKMRPLLQVLFTTESKTVRLSSKVYNYYHIKKLREIGIINVIDNTHYFYTTATKHYITPRATEYEINKEKLQQLLLTIEAEQKQLQQGAGVGTGVQVNHQQRQRQIQFLLELLLSGNNDNKITHDFILFLLKPNLRKLYLQELTNVRAHRGIEQQ